MPTPSQFAHSLPANGSRGGKPENTSQGGEGSASPQFAPKPQFAFSVPQARPRAQKEQAVPNPDKTINVKQLEDGAVPPSVIAEARLEGPDGTNGDEMLLGSIQERRAIVSTSHPHYPSVSPGTTDRPLKRRREFELLSPRLKSQVPRAQQEESTFAAPRFKSSLAFKPSGTTAQPPSVDFSAAPRTRFVLPPEEKEPTSSSTVPVLLPDVFSPHRRKERFVPGGWASQVRSWVIEASASSGLSPPSLQRQRPDVVTGAPEDAVLVRVLEVHSENGRANPLLLRGAVVDSQGSGSQRANIMLAGGTARLAVTETTEQAVALVRPGVLIHLKPPLWDVALSGLLESDSKLWVVCASWRIV